MKWLISLLLFFFVLSAAAQEIDKPNKKTNLIVVTCQDTGKILFDKAVEILTDRNFPIQTMTETARAIYTGEKQVPKWVVPMRLFVRVKGNKVYISGTIKYTLSGEHTSDINYFRGPATRSFPQAAWLEMHALAETFKGTITYQSK